jgi:hypothetical protein
MAFFLADATIKVYSKQQTSASSHTNTNTTFFRKAAILITKVTLKTPTI